MHITISATAARALVAPVARAVERRNTIPILSNCHIAADAAGEIRITGTDLDLMITASGEADVTAPGETTVPAKMLEDILRRMPDGAAIEIAQVDNALRISAGRSRFHLQTLPATDFPMLAPGEWTWTAQAEAAALADALGPVQGAISTEEARFYLNGIYFTRPASGEGVFEGIGGTTWLVATDGHRLGLAGLDTGTPAPGFILPRKAVGELLALASATKKPVAMSASDRMFHASAETADGRTVAMTSKLIDGTFPEFTRVIPAANDKVYSVDGAEFRAAVDRVSIVSSERGRAVKLTFADGALAIEVRNPDAGSAEAEIACAQVSGPEEPMTIGFNSRYAADVAAWAGGETITIAMADPGAPALVRGAAGRLHVLMPMRV